MPIEMLAGRRLPPNAERRPIHILLEREGWSLNVERVRRLYKLEGLQMHLKPPRRRVTAKLRSDRCDVIEPHQFGRWTGCSRRLSTADGSGRRPSSTPDRGFAQRYAAAAQQKPWM